MARPALSEDEVLLAVKEWLLGGQWSILAYRSPGGHGGMSVEVPRETGQPPGRVVLDLVCVKHSVALCVEAKGRASRADEQKLRRLFASPAARTAVAEWVCHRPDASTRRRRKALVLLPTLAYSQGALIPDDFVVLVAGPRSQITCHVGARVLSHRRVVAALGLTG